MPEHRDDLIYFYLILDEMVSWIFLGSMFDLKNVLPVFSKKRKDWVNDDVQYALWTVFGHLECLVSGWLWDQMKTHVESPKEDQRCREGSFELEGKSSTKLINYYDERKHRYGVTKLDARWIFIVMRIKDVLEEHTITLNRPKILRRCSPKSLTDR